MNSCGFSEADYGKLQARAERKRFLAGDRIFCEGDNADYVYLIEAGRISIYLEKFTVRDEIHTLGPGDCFGEMALLLDEKRNASATAVEDTRLLALSKHAFLDLLKTDHALAEKVRTLLAARNEELILRETLISSSGIDGAHLHVSIKGDPSLRETALFRERYESFADKVLPQLSPSLDELLIRRCVYQIFIGFNSGEIRTASLLNPFAEEVHQIAKLLDPAYIDRHFPAISYTQKIQMIRNVYQYLNSTSWYSNLPDHLKTIWDKYYETWECVPPEEISKVVSSLPTLRSIQNFYIRNVTISIVRDAIHMQFNCDGTHIVSSEKYEHFLEDNL